MAIWALDLHLRCEQSLEKYLGFFHGNGACALTKILYLRASASDFCPEKANDKAGSVTDCLLTIEMSGGIGAPPGLGEGGFGDVGEAVLCFQTM